MSKLLEILSTEFVLKNPRDASVLIGAVVPIVGVFLVVSRRTILALALPQVSILGVALTAAVGTLMGAHWMTEKGASWFPVIAIGGASAAMAAAIAWEFFVERRLATPADAETGSLYALAAAATMAIASSRLVPELGLLETLQGNILAVPDNLLHSAALGFAGILLPLFFLRRWLHFVLYDQMLAFSSGLPANRLAFLTLGLVSLTIALGGLCAGPLTIFAFLVIPPLTFLPVVKHMRGVYIASSLTGVLAGFCGFWISYSVDDIPIPSAQILLLCAVWVCVRLWMLVRFPSKAIAIVAD